MRYFFEKAEEHGVANCLANLCKFGEDLGCDPADQLQGSLGPFDRALPECPESVPSVCQKTGMSEGASQECPSSVRDAFLPLWGHSRMFFLTHSGLEGSRVVIPPTLDGGPNSHFLEKEGCGVQKPQVPLLSWKREFSATKKTFFSSKGPQGKRGFLTDRGNGDF